MKWNFEELFSIFRRDAEVQRLDAKVISNLSQYSVICKHAREDVKNTFTARDKELNRRRNLDKLRERNPRNRQMIVSFLLSRSLPDFRLFSLTILIRGNDSLKPSRSLWKLPSKYPVL